MTAGSVSPSPVLVLGLGNLLLQDDGTGIELLRRIESSAPPGDRVEFIDGGTQGLNLLGLLENRKLVVVLDAVQLGSDAGTIHVIRGPEITKLRAQRSTTAHEGNALELLTVSRILGAEPDEVLVIGIEPLHFGTGIGLSEPVTAALSRAEAIIRLAIDSAGGFKARCV